MSDDAPVAAEAEPAPPPLPRLRIQHLMLWTALSAVLLVVSQTRLIHAIFPGVWSASSVVNPIAVAACVTVLGLRWRWRRATGLMLTEPGHAIALLTVIRFSFSLPALAVYARHGAEWRSGGFNWSDLSRFEITLLTAWPWVGGFVAGVVALVIAFRLKEGAAWRGLFVASPVLAVAGVVVKPFLNQWLVPGLATGANLGWLYLAQMWPQLAWLGLLVMVCVCDNKPRHWTHWWGVLATIVPLIVFVGSVLVGIATGAFVVE